MQTNNTLGPQSRHSRPAALGRTLRWKLAILGLIGGAIALIGGCHFHAGGGHHGGHGGGHHGHCDW